MQRSRVAASSAEAHEHKQLRLRCLQIGLQQVCLVGAALRDSWKVHDGKLPGGRHRHLRGHLASVRWGKQQTVTLSCRCQTGGHKTAGAPASAPNRLLAQQTSQGVQKALPGLTPDSPSCSRHQLCMPSGSPLPPPPALSVCGQEWSSTPARMEQKKIASLAEEHT